MPTTIYNFDTPSNYTYDNTKIEVVSSVAQLILGNGILAFNQDFAADAGFTYDNTLIEFVAGLMQQKDRTPANSVFAATYAASLNLDWHKTGALSATLNGTPTLSGGKMVCTGAQGLYYLKNTATIETHKFKYTPNYTGGPVTNINLVASHNGTNNNDRVVLTNSPSGNNFRLSLYNSTGTVIYNTVTIGGTFSFVASQEYEIELVIDSVAGTSRLFIDGVLHGTLTSGAWTRGVSQHRYWLGASTVVYNVAEGSFDDYIVFDDAQHSAGYTPGYTIDTLYGASVVDLATFTHGQLGGILSFTSFATTQAGTPRYAFNVGGGGLQYWDGAAWSSSDGTYAQSNDAATVSTNIATLAVSGQTTLDVRMSFVDDNTISSIDDMTVGHIGGTNYPGNNPTIKPVSTVQQDAITSFAAIFTAANNDDINVTFEVGGQQKYWDGAAWVNSDGTFTQSNTIAVAAANVATMLVTGALTPVFFLHSSNGGSTPSIDSATIVYSAFGGNPTPENVTTVFGYIYDANNQPLLGEVVTATPQILGLSNNKQIKTQAISATTNASGYWEMELIDTLTSSEQFAYVFVIDSQTFLKRIPIAVTTAFNALVDSP